MSDEYEKCKKWLEEAFEKKIKEIGIEKWRDAMMLNPPPKWDKENYRNRKKR